MNELQQLTDYINQSRELKISDEQIASSLLTSWPLAIVRQAFEQQKKKKPIIEITRLFKEYRLSESVVVMAINGIYKLEVYEGEFLAISGQSGSGKSTLLNMLGMIDEPTSGDIIINGVNTASMSEHMKTEYRLKVLGYIFQFFNLLENYTAIENIMFQLKLNGVGHYKAKSKAKEILEFLDMQDRADNYPSELSGGQQQRLAIGRAIAKDAPLLLADEPTAHLDTQNGQKVMELLRNVSVNFGKTVILVTHEPTYAKMADRIVYLADGQVTGIEETHIAHINWDRLERQMAADASATPPPAEPIPAAEAASGDEQAVPIHPAQ